jgi:hypothetical protein
VNAKPKAKPIRKLDPVQGEIPEKPGAPKVTIPAFSMEHMLIDITGDDIVEASVSRDEDLEWSMERPTDGDWGSIVLEPGQTDSMTPFETDRFGLGWPHSFRRRF